MEEETLGKKPTLKARCDDLERRVGELEVWRAGSGTPTQTKPSSLAPEAATEPAEVEDLMPADEIRALLGGEDVPQSDAEGTKGPQVEFLGTVASEVQEEEPAWPPEIAPDMMIEALAVFDTFQGKPVVFAAEPVDQARVRLLLEQCGVQVPVIGRPIEDIVPKLKELYENPV